MSIPSDAGAPLRTRVMIVEDQASLREMLADVLAAMPEFEVVAQAADFEEATRKAVAAQPEVVILDWRFPGGGGLAFLRAMRSHRLHSHVLVLSGNASEETVAEALTNGARGFFEKGGNLEEFLHALHTVASGGAYFGPQVAEIVKRMVHRRASLSDESAAATAGQETTDNGAAALEAAVAHET